MYQQKLRNYISKALIISVLLYIQFKTISNNSMMNYDRRKRI